MSNLANDFAAILQQVRRPGNYYVSGRVDIHTPRLEVEGVGNEGASFERFYQRAALVLWPRASRARVVADSGLDGSIPFLGELVRRWEENGRAPEDRTRQEALDLAKQIRQAWPTHDWERKRASENGHGRALLDSLARLGDLEQRTAFLTDQALAGAYGPADNPSLVELLRQLPPVRARELLHALMAGNGLLQPGACARLLLLCSEPPSLAAASLQPAAAALLAALPDGSERPDEQPAFRNVAPSRATPELVAVTLTALERIDPALAGKALELFLSRPEIYPLDALLLPAALALHQGVSSSEPASFASLRRAVLAHLERRIGEPLEAPADWTRPAEVTCSCTRCTDLNRFLAAPDQPRWELKARKADRGHVEQMVARHRCDLDLTTERRGSPHTLVCTKNQAGYQRRVRQRQQDLEHRARLAG